MAQARCLLRACRIAPLQTHRHISHYRSIPLPVKYIHFILSVFHRHPCSVPFQTRTATKNRTQQTSPFLASDQYVTLQFPVSPSLLFLYVRVCHGGHPKSKSFLTHQCAYPQISQICSNILCIFAAETGNICTLIRQYKRRFIVERFLVG